MTQMEKKEAGIFFKEFLSNHKVLRIIKCHKPHWKVMVSLQQRMQIRRQQTEKLQHSQRWQPSPRNEWGNLKLQMTAENSQGLSPTTGFS